MSLPSTASGPGPSTVLWATASKEWVIPPKPKPGRKPKKDSPAALEQGVDEPAQGDTKGRRVQNRAAQKAFRERKQSQLAELQARLEKYEQGEIERTIALQNVSKKLKEENENLRAENLSLRERIAHLERDSKPTVALEPVAPTGTKRTRAGPTTPVKRPRVSSPPLNSAYAPDYGSTPPAMAHSPDTSFSLSPEPPVLPDYPDQDNAPMVVPAFDCGFCNEDTPCVCREIAMQAQASPTKPDDTGIIVHSTQLSSPPPPSILDNLPAFQPAVPLKRNTTSTKKAPIFKIVQKEPIVGDATCSGDPKNCSACQGDSFGQAFCAAVGKSVAAMSPSTSTFKRCADCPGDCGMASSSASSGSFSLSASTKTMPLNAAWHQFKSHPNVSFADLSMLADVVARRSKCTGPTVSIVPALGSATPEREIPDNSLPGLKRETRSPPPRLVPEEILIECGKRRVREVEVSAVNQALRILDTKYGSL